MALGFDAIGAISAQCVTWAVPVQIAMGTLHGVSLSLQLLQGFSARQMFSGQVSLGCPGYSTWCLCGAQSLLLLAAPCVWYPRSPAVPSHSALCSAGGCPVPAFPPCWGTEPS